VDCQPDSPGACEGSAYGTTVHKSRAFALRLGQMVGEVREALRTSPAGA
jgi:hypothetical protein